MIKRKYLFPPSEVGIGPHRSICILSSRRLVIVPVEGWLFRFECPYAHPSQKASVPTILSTLSTIWWLTMRWQLSMPRCPRRLWRMLMSIDLKGGEARFAVTFCVTGVASRVYRSPSSVANALAMISLVSLSMYSQTLLSNTTLQCGRRADCPTDRSVTLRSGTNRTSLNWPSFCFPLTLNRRRSVPFPVAKISESSPRLMGMGFERVLNDAESNNSLL